MSACHAMERGLRLAVSPEVRSLRRLLYCGEWIESHALHVYLLHLPDFLGYPDAIRLAKDRPEIVQRGLALKKAGNELMTVLGGREIHPINVRIGGFYRCPAREELQAIRTKLETALYLAEETVRLAAGLTFPNVEEDYEFVSLRHPVEYPMNEGEVVSSRGIRIPQTRYDEEFQEVQVPYSNALHSVRRGGGSYLVGPLARYALNRDRLGPRADAIVREVGLEPVVRNPFRSVIVRAVEMVEACDQALQIIGQYRPPARPYVEATPPFASDECTAITEAPRGMLYHRYRLNAAGLIEEARIVAPTSQNQKRIEDDVRDVVERSIDLPEESLTHECERAIRNHDPCISCATHFLALDLVRE
ncbi:nickel-dependent hydrogenase, large subunit [mine drainage metagenome]|uniref:Nickel-dependent hydrogenase, large subunit n=1 Tax=mine drainage metagenome TaxID=410659 RepID=T1B4T6_9ZZZZ